MQDATWRTGPRAHWLDQGRERLPVISYATFRHCEEGAPPDEALPFKIEDFLTVFEIASS